MFSVFYVCDDITNIVDDLDLLKKETCMTKPIFLHFCFDFSFNFYIFKYFSNISYHAKLHVLGKSQYISFDIDVENVLKSIDNAIP